MTVERWNELVDAFDVDALARQLESVGCPYVMMTVGQNSGFYLSPNNRYDEIVGIEPSRCAGRDLIADLASALRRRKVRLLVYLPAGAPAGDRTARQRLMWQDGPEPNREFQANWEKVIREWSVRWDESVAGWWFDGCYWPNAMYRSEQEPNFASFARAARAGNPDSALAFNPGAVNRTISVTPHEDYIAGEVAHPRLHSIKHVHDGRVDGARLHMLSHLGKAWGGGPARFPTGDVVEFTRQTVDAGGFVTWDVPVRNDGTIPQEFLEQLAAVAAAVGRGSAAKPTRDVTRGD
jgi:alpha-L-fucosidase